MSEERENELDLGEIEPGRAPDRRKVAWGKHPWAPSAIDEWERKDGGGDGPDDPMGTGGGDGPEG